MLKKIRNNFYQFCNYMELFIGLFVIVGIVIALIGIVGDIGILWQNRGDMDAFYQYLDAIFTIVISIEFLKMLCQPNSDTVLEVLIFLVARHMIIGDTTAVEDLISVISITVLFGVKKLVKLTAKKTGKPLTFNPVKKSKEDKNDKPTE